MKIERRLVVAKGWEEERMRNAFLMGTGLFLGSDEIFWN